MSRRPFARNHSAEFKAKVALAAVRGRPDTVRSWQASSTCTRTRSRNGRPSCWIGRRSYLVPDTGQAEKPVDMNRPLHAKIGELRRWRTIF